MPGKNKGREKRNAAPSGGTPGATSKPPEAGKKQEGFPPRNFRGTMALLML